MESRCPSSVERCGASDQEHEHSIGQSVAGHCWCVLLVRLCQFMPQDRVCEFASLSPVRLLEETQRAIDPDIYETHLSLIRTGRDLDANAKVMDNCFAWVSHHQRTQNLEKDRNRVAELMQALERDVERLRQVTLLTHEV